MALELNFDEVKRRLKRLWKPLSVRENKDFFKIYLDVSTEAELGCWKEGDALTFRLSQSLTYLFCHADGEIELAYAYSLFPPPQEVQAKELSQFSLQWMGIFRRNCWLSGCPIEASAHEKAEWIRGFRREEIEAWNLKF